MPQSLHSPGDFARIPSCIGQTKFATSLGATPATAGVTHGSIQLVLPSGSVKLASKNVAFLKTPAGPVKCEPSPASGTTVFSYPHATTRLKFVAGTPTGCSLNRSHSQTSSLPASNTN